MSKVVASAAGEFLERLRVEASSLNTDRSGTINDEKRGSDFLDVFFHYLTTHYKILN